ncbi:hypothetical protein [Pseudomonas phage PA1C]|uniref:Uncharacterized protein n=2 Tax=root TaxID=1 RepID=A0A5C1K801_9CAUD|nr:hypothetical protein PP933_gp293 [Pseudomonas phage vB_PaeM_PS119XW]QBX32450.1 hypothetical protein [Pseudomonas phage PA1C]QEM42022.1 hypothetical protein [Pseudomonas phage vB_PaeM_PS119XW]
MQSNSIRNQILVMTDDPATSLAIRNVLSNGLTSLGLNHEVMHTGREDYDNLDPAVILSKFKEDDYHLTVSEHAIHPCGTKVSPPVNNAINPLWSKELRISVLGGTHRGKSILCQVIYHILVQHLKLIDANKFTLRDIDGPRFAFESPLDTEHWPAAAEAISRWGIDLRSVFLESTQSLDPILRRSI